MKTTLDLRDALLLRAKRLSKRAGRPLRALVEEGLRYVLEQAWHQIDAWIPSKPTKVEPGAALCVVRHGEP